MIKTENFRNSTICAPATSGDSSAALAIIRLSGPDAHGIMNTLFRPVTKAPLLPRRIYFGYIYDHERLIDEVILHISAAPSSFTGEDTAEISCHGSQYIIQEIMRLAIEAGATPALPGEFTQRAFLNGKIDLAQAEAVADLIASENEASHRLAVQQMRGGFSQEIHSLRNALVEFTSLIELELDFSEEDVTFADRNQLTSLLEQMLLTIESLCVSFRIGNVLKNGVPTAIVGATNVGKSTLLNAILGEERAIVSEIHGTTRDTVEEEITIEGVRFRLIDTAGLRASQEEIERLGINRSRQKIGSASLLLLVLDANQPELWQEQISQVASQLDSKAQEVIVVLNKCERFNQEGFFYNNNDLISNVKAISQAKSIPIFAIAAVSAKFKLGIDSLKALLTASIRARFDAARLSPNAILVTNLRHLNALQQAQKSLLRVREGLTTQLPTDLIAQDLRQALYELGTISGDITTDEVLGNIFGKFCIGK